MLCVLHFNLGEWPRAAWDVWCMGQGCWGRCPIPWHCQLIPQAEKCIVLWWEICKAEPSFPIPSVESMGGKSLQYFLGMEMSSRNRLWEGAVAWTEQQITLVFYSLLLVIHHDFPPDPSTSIYNKNLALGHLPAILSVLELVSFRGKFPCPGETGERSSFPGFVPLFIVILPSGRPEQFPSPPLHVHPSNGFRIWHWKIKFKKNTPPNTQGIENIQIYCSALSSLHHCLRRAGTGPDFFLITNLNYSTGHREIKPYKSH